MAILDLDVALNAFRILFDLFLLGGTLFCVGESLSLMKMLFTYTQKVHQQVQIYNHTKLNI